MSKVRLVDKEPSSRSKPMQVLVLGMCRTGTFSIYTALQKLGYRPYHMAEAVKDPPRNFGLWEEALRLKYGKGPPGAAPWGRREFDVMLGDYDAVADVPCALFVEELPAAYPDAKVVLTLRDPERWRVSMESTVGRVMGWRTWPWLALWDGGFIGPWYSFANMLGWEAWRNDLSKDGPARAAFIEHYDLVRRVVPKERLLEFEAKDGWAPLCAFLGKEIPQDEEYPNTNDAKEFVAMHHLLWYMGLGKAVLKIGVVVLPPLACWYFAPSLRRLWNFAVVDWVVYVNHPWRGRRR